MTNKMLRLRMLLLQFKIMWPYSLLMVAVAIGATILYVGILAGIIGLIGFLIYWVIKHIVVTLILLILVVILFLTHK